MPEPLDPSVPAAPAAPTEDEVSNRILTIPNLLSFLRLLGVPLFLWLILVPKADTAAFVLLALSGITDWLDGVIARATGQTSRLGQLLDPLADRLYIVATLVGLALRAIIPWWLVVVIVARDLVLAVVLARLKGRGITGLPVHYLGKAATFCLMWGFPILLLGTGATGDGATFADVARAVGAKVEAVGHPVTRNVLFVANHLSWIDILAMGGVTGTAFIAKAEVKTTPVVGRLADMNRTLYVSRDDRLGVADQIARVRDAMSENHAITVFPEGTTGDGTALLPFKSSLMGVVEPPPPGLVVQPVLIDYGDAAEVAWVGAEPGLHHALRVLARPGRFPFRLTFLEAFDPAQVGNRKAVTALARERIAEAFAKL